MPRNLLISSLCWLTLTAGSALAEAPNDLAAVMGLSAADGSVRTTTSVRMALSSIPGTDTVMSMHAPLQAQMPQVRACFGQAMVRRADVEGRVVVQVERDPRGKARSKVTLDETGDAELSACVSDAFAAADLRNVKTARAGAIVTIDLTNPTARMRGPTRAPEVAVAQISGGRLRSDGGTQNGEVRFSIEASAYARESVVVLHRDLQSRLAGLLDCRRKASRRNAPAEGTITGGLVVSEKGDAKLARPKSSLRDRNAGQCVSTWLSKADKTKLKALDAELAIEFTR